MIAFFTGIINVVLTLMKYATTYQHRAGRLAAFGLTWH